MSGTGPGHGGTPDDVAARAPRRTAPDAPELSAPATVVDAAPCAAPRTYAALGFAGISADSAPYTPPPLSPERPARRTAGTAPPTPFTIYGHAAQYNYDDLGGDPADDPVSHVGGTFLGGSNVGDHAAPSGYEVAVALSDLAEGGYTTFASARETPAVNSPPRASGHPAADTPAPEVPAATLSEKQQHEAQARARRRAMAARKVRHFPGRFSPF